MKKVSVDFPEFEHLSISVARIHHDPESRMKKNSIYPVFANLVIIIHVTRLLCSFQLICSQNQSAGFQVGIKKRVGQKVVTFFKKSMEM